LKFITEVEAHN